MSFARDPQDQYGRWYHGHLTIDTPEGQFQSALDVDTPSGVGVSYRISRSLATSDLGPVAALPNGWHALVANAASGALDYVRSPMFRDAVWRLPFPQLELPVKRVPTPDPGPLAIEAAAVETAEAPAAAAAVAGASEEKATAASRGVPYESLPTVVRRGLELTIPWFQLYRPWFPSTGDNALTALETELPNATRIYLFGDHYQDGLGVHDVHMNQGDPAGSQWWATDGIWQDGAVCIERANGTLFAWQVKFNSQSFRTDTSGHPA